MKNLPTTVTFLLSCALCGAQEFSSMDENADPGPAVVETTIATAKPVIWGIAFTLFDGRATWDKAGSANAAGEAVWIDDELPANASLEATGGDTWTWVDANPAPFSGTKAHQSTLGPGEHQHYTHAQGAMPYAAGDTLFAYVYLDPQNPPTEVMLQWHWGDTWVRAYWGENRLWPGIAMGPLPPVGKWVRLEVPVAALGIK